MDEALTSPGALARAIEARSEGRPIEDLYVLVELQLRLGTVAMADVFLWLARQDDLVGVRPSVPRRQGGAWMCTLVMAGTAVMVLNRHDALLRRPGVRGASELREVSATATSPEPWTRWLRDKGMG
jgi:hypothetical protein